MNKYHLIFITILILHLSCFGITMFAISESANICNTTESRAMSLESNNITRLIMQMNDKGKALILLIPCFLVFLYVLTYKSMIKGKIQEEAFEAILYAILVMFIYNIFNDAIIFINIFVI